MLEGYTPPAEEKLAAAYRSVASTLGVGLSAKTALPRLRQSRVWHCYCAAGAVGDECVRTACEAVGPVSTCWNGITSKPLTGTEARLPAGASGLLCAPLPCSQAPGRKDSSRPMLGE
jgi:hypothetical protein